MIGFDKSSLMRQQRLAVLAAYAMMALPAAFILASETLLKEPNAEVASTVYPLLRYIFIGLAVAEVIVVTILKGRILANAQEDIGAGEEVFTRRLFTAFIVPYSAWMFIAVYGFILYLLGGDKNELYAFVGVSLVMMIVNYPKYEDWESRLKDYLDG